MAQSEVFQSQEENKIDITATLRRATAINGESITFTILSGAGGLSLLASEDGTLNTVTTATNSDGIAHAYYTVGSTLAGVTPGIAVIKVEAISASIPAKEIYVLTKFIDNFEMGQNAGGSLQVSGNDWDSEIAVLQSGLSRPNSGSTVAVLATAASGFSTADSVIRLTKTFATSTPSVGLPHQHIDASSFNALSYWIRNSIASTSQVTVELIIGDGGGLSTSTGSTWRQTIPATVTTDWTRIVVNIKDTEFHRIITNGSGGGSLDLANITGFNLLYSSNGVTGEQQTLYVDDVNFFANPIISLSADRIFVKRNTGVFNLTALVEKIGVPVNNQSLRVTAVGAGKLNGQSQNPITVITGADGKATFTYSAPGVAEMANISVIVELTE